MAKVASLGQGPVDAENAFFRSIGGSWFTTRLFAGWLDKETGRRLREGWDALGRGKGEHLFREYLRPRRPRRSPIKPLALGDKIDRRWTRAARNHRPGRGGYDYLDDANFSSSNLQLLNVGCGRARIGQRWLQVTLDFMRFCEFLFLSNFCSFRKRIFRFVRNFNPRKCLRYWWVCFCKKNLWFNVVWNEKKKSWVSSNFSR